jgi:oligosaccharide 4-alpha-D-glucosyltransferase
MNKNQFLQLKYIFLLFLLFSPFLSHSQEVWLVPESPLVTDTVTLYFNSNQGNQGLKGYSGDIYFHTGVITEKSLDAADWKFVVGNWGLDDKRVKMTALNDSIYTATFVIQDFYQLAEQENAQQLAFVFRNVDGSLVCKTEKNEDFLVSVNGYVPQTKGKPGYVFNSRNYVSYHFKGNSLDITTSHGLVTVDFFTPKIVRIRNFKGESETKDSSDAVILEPVLQLPMVEEKGKWLVYQSDSMQVLFHKTPFYAAFVYHGDTVLQEEKGFFERTDNCGLRFKIKENEKFYGLGERAISFDLTGNHYELYNRPHYGYEIGAKNLNFSVPLVVSSDKYLVLFDNPQKGYADIGEAEDGIFEWGAIGGLIKYFFIAGNDFYDIEEQYTLLTGRQPMPPRWALGNLQSRMAYRTQKETDSIVRLMQARNFPIDAIILDYYWFGDSILGTMGRLDWYKPNWPSPSTMISNFKKRGVKTILITEPYILDSLKNFKIAADLGILATDSAGNAYVNYEFYFGNGGLIDIFQPKAQAWFWKKYVKQINMGVAGWWGDLGEPENHPSDQVHVSGMADEVHNIYAQYWHRMLFDEYRKNYPLVRLFNLNRAGFAGSQRYSIYPWTGDVARTWGGLQAQMPLLLHMSMSGLPFIHSDAGGFAGGVKDDELYTRWLQMASFSPILRPHGSGIPSEAVFFSEQTQDIVRNFMKTRYSLLPYIYTTAMLASVKGHPIVRPLFFDFPNENETYGISGEYMFGKNMLVAPVVEQGQKTMAVYLPKEIWWGFWDDKHYVGNGYQNIGLQIETIPVFVKGGSFIPMVEPVNSTDDYSSQLLYLRYYPGELQKKYFGSMFEDNGKTYGTIGRGEFEMLNFSAIQDEKGDLKIEMLKDGWDFEGMPKQRVIKLEIVAQDAAQKKKITINGEAVKKKNPDKLVEGYYYENNRLVINFNWSGELLEIDIVNK